MTQTTYSFTDQLATGAQGEARLDAHFARWFIIRHATPEEQRQGIDRIYIGRADGRTYRVEYKTDHAANQTGNAFVETVSVDTDNKPGWAFTSQSNFLLYYITIAEVVYVVDFAKLRRRLPTWQRSYRLRKIPNRGYHTHGLLVPLDEFERLADKIISL